MTVVSLDDFDSARPPHDDFSVEVRVPTNAHRLLLRRELDRLHDCTAPLRQDRRWSFDFSPLEGVYRIEFLSEQRQRRVTPTSTPATYRVGYAIGQAAAALVAFVVAILTLRFWRGGS